MEALLEDDVEPLVDGGKAVDGENDAGVGGGGKLGGGADCLVVIRRNSQRSAPFINDHIIVRVHGHTSPYSFLGFLTVGLSSYQMHSGLLF